ncbi:MAG: hypothetical protein J7L26_09885 [Candidatus Aminicenantes bacterium]|nr:hypothetical protein [Candidatus Aminicenantes bacterium]
MKKKVKCIELRTVEGRAILVLYLYEKEIVLEDSQETKAQKNLKEPEKEKAKASSKSEEPLMTDAQKRYLFRILADNGIEGDKAHQQLKELFQVNSLKEVTKLEASRMIERLLEEAKGGKDAEPPF